jgi:hypothetical protein
MKAEVGEKKKIENRNEKTLAEKGNSTTHRKKMPDVEGINIYIHIHTQNIFWNDVEGDDKVANEKWMIFTGNISAHFILTSWICRMRAQKMCLKENVPFTVSTTLLQLAFAVEQLCACK